MPKMSVAKYMALALEEYGVTSVFFVPTMLSRMLYEMEEHTSISRIMTHGEKSAAYMADGYARASGHLGVCFAQNVGAANLAAGLRDPFLARTPMLAMTGGPFEWSRGRHYYQEIEDFPLFKSVTKFSTQVNDPVHLPSMLAQAARSATTGKPGPTHLELAGHSADAFEYAEIDVELPTDGPYTVPRVRVQPDPDAIAAALKVLLAAQRPVIVAGGGVRTAGASAELISLAERLGIPIATSMNAKATVPGNHPLNVGVPGLYPRASANQVLVEADLVFYVGSQTGSQVSLTWTIPSRDTRIIQLDLDPEEFGRHYMNTLGVHGDAKLGLAAMLAAVGDAGPEARATWVARTQDLGRRWHQAVDEQLSSDAVPMRPERLSAELTQHLPENAILMSDTGHSGMWTAGYVDLNSPGQDYLRAAGSLGWGLPAALGAQLGAPGKQVVLFTGDGGAYYHIGELETAARWNIPAIIVINNNGALNQEIGIYSKAYGGSLHGRHGDLWHFNNVDFTKVAESMGVTGLAVNKPSEFAGALEQAVATNGPVVIDVRTDIGVGAPRASAERAAD